MARIAGAKEPDNYVKWHSGLRPGDEGYVAGPKDPVQAQIARLEAENRELRRKMDERSKATAEEVVDEPVVTMPVKEPSKGLFRGR
jgi:hypothetical protein